MSSPPAKESTKWQSELAAECARRGFAAPLYNAYSDRRGGRTAWSSTVTVEDWNRSARHWYDGQFIHNAREDAAEVMLTQLRNPAVYGSPRRQTSGNGGNGGRHSTFGTR